MKKFIDRLQDPTPLIFDGGFGTELFARGIELANSALANELHPDAVTDIHSVYIEAGANVIGTNTFVASFPHLEMAGKDASASDKLVVVLDFGGTKSCSNGTFTITFPSTSSGTPAGTDSLISITS